MSHRLPRLSLPLAAAASMIFGGSCLCDAFRDKRDAFLIQEWTLNPVTCAVEGEDIRDERRETHLLVNPLGQTNDTEAVVTTCLLSDDVERGCAMLGEPLPVNASIWLRMQRGQGNTWVSQQVVHESDGACSGYLEQATLTFPVTQQFRLEIRRSKWSLPDSGNCVLEGPAHARREGCTELEVLRGDFEVELFGEYESSSSGSSFDD